MSCPEKGGPLKRLRARSTRAGSAAKQWQGRDTRSSVGRDTVPMHLARSPKKIGSLSKRQRPMPRNRGLRTTDLSNCLKKSACSVRFNFSIRFCYLFHTLSFSEPEGHGIQPPQEDSVFIFDVSGKLHLSFFLLYNPRSLFFSVSTNLGGKKSFNDRTSKLADRKIYLFCQVVFISLYPTDEDLHKTYLD